MDTTILEDIGLSKREIEVYLALLKNGQSKAADVKRLTQLQNSVIHLCLNNLTQKGLVLTVHKGRLRYYSAQDPQLLLSYIEDKKKRVEQLLPQLLQSQNKSPEYTVTVYEGFKGLLAIHDELLGELEKGEDLIVLGAPKEASDYFEEYLADFHEQRIKKKVVMKALYKKSATFATKRKKLPLTSVKYLPEGVAPPMWTTVYKDKSILIVLGDVLLGIVIKNEPIAQNFKEYFSLMWKVSR